MSTTQRIINENYEKVPTQEESETEKADHYGFGVRHVQCLLMFLYLSTAFIARGHLSVSIVAMVDQSMYNNSTNNESALVNDTTVNLHNETNVNDYAIEHKANINVTKIDGSGQPNITEGNDKNSTDGESIWNANRTYKWPKPIQEMILGSFFVGYFIMMFPSGMICQRFGGKLPLQVSMFVNGVISFISPWLIAWGGYKAACACRIVQGLSQAGTYPATITLLAAWVPVSERGSLSTYVFTGSMFGTIISFQLGGLLASSTWGWPSSFCCTGILCFIAFAVLTIFAAASPQEHKFISEEEKRFIVGHLKPSTGRSLSVPWKAVFTSKHVWAIISTHVGCSIAFFYLFTQVPSYMHYILQFDVKKSGFLSSLPYIANIIASFIMGYLSDYCSNRNIISIKNSRILYNSIAAVGMAICMTSVSFFESPGLAVACFVVGMFFHAGIHTGWMLNYMDLSPNFSGAIFSIGNTLMNVFSIVMPMVISTILVDVTNKYQWRTILILIAAIVFFCNVIFVCFISTEVQPWNDHNSTDGHQLETGTDEEQTQEKKDEL